MPGVKPLASPWYILIWPSVSLSVRADCTVAEKSEGICQGLWQGKNQAICQGFCPSFFSQGCNPWQKVCDECFCECFCPWEIPSQTSSLPGILSFSQGFCPWQNVMFLVVLLYKKKTIKVALKIVWEKSWSIYWG